MKDSQNVSDEIVDTTVSQEDAPERKEYRVVSENGLFKRGEQYDEGSIIELDKKTAANFLEAGDIEEL